MFELINVCLKGKTRLKRRITCHRAYGLFWCFFVQIRATLYGLYRPRTAARRVIVHGSGRNKREGRVMVLSCAYLSYCLCQ